MKNDMFAEACVLAQEQWVTAFTMTESKEEHSFSRQFNRRMDRLYGKMRGDHYHHLTRATLTVLVAAALIAALMIASVGYAPARRYLIEVFDDHTEFRTENSGLTSIPVDIHFGFIPEGFEYLGTHQMPLTLLSFTNSSTTSISGPSAVVGTGISSKPKYSVMAK